MLESLKLRCWFRKPCHFYKLLNERSTSYLFSLIPNLNRVHETRHSINIPAVHLRRDYFKDSSFYYKPDWKIRNSESLSIFKKNLINVIWPCANSIFDVHNPYEFKLLTRLCLGASQLHDHKFRHWFQDTLNLLYDCRNNTETIKLFFLHCSSFHTPRQTFLTNIRDINEQILSHNKYQLIQTFLYGSPIRLILNATIEYLISTEQFKFLLFN